MTVVGRRLGTALLVCGALAGILVACTSSPPAPAPSPRVDLPATVQDGDAQVSGTVDARVRRFAGIRYAQPPVGELRWAEPQPAPPARGVVDATKPGGQCAQSSAVPGAQPTANEDCLYLNITTPRAQVPGIALPVMVWWHGGGYIAGAGNLYDAARLVAQGDVIVVTINYRLGVLGYLGLPGLPGSGTFGFADQLESLRWVQAHIGAYGGDPGNVTVFGESNGGMTTCALLTSPAARGLVQRAAMQSGTCGLNWPAGGFYPGANPQTPYTSLQNSEAAGTAIATALGCSPGDLACLRSQPVDKLLPLTPPDGFMAWGTPLLPLDPAEALRTGQFLDIPVLTGANHDEMRFLIGGAIIADPITPERYPRLVVTSYPTTAADVLREYPLSHYADGADAWTTVAQDGMWACPTFRDHQLLARHTRVFAYEFNDPDAPNVSGLPVPAEFPIRAGHTFELAYLFDLGGTPAPFTPAQQQLADQMTTYWTTFARTGDPNGPGSPTWAPFDAGDTTLTLALAPGPGAITPTYFQRDHRCGFWAGQS